MQARKLIIKHLLTIIYITFVVLNISDSSWFVAFVQPAAVTVISNSFPKYMTVCYGFAYLQSVINIWISLISSSFIRFLIVLDELK